MPPGTRSFWPDKSRTRASTRTAIPFFSRLRFSRPTPLTHGILQPSVCLVLQGKKRILIGRDVVSYGPGSYVASSVNMPLAGQVIEASPARPYLGIMIELDPREIAATVIEAKLPAPAGPRRSRGALVAHADQLLWDAVMRLVRLLEQPRDIPFLAPVIKQEMLYRLLTAEDGFPSWQHGIADRDGLAVGRAIEWLKRNFVLPLRMDELARGSGLGVSSFHRKFKAVTTLAPLQYQKRCLLEARRLLLARVTDAATAAFTVGYESPSQFSREYRRLFGAPPREDIEQLRKTAVLLEQN